MGGKMWKSLTDKQKQSLKNLFFKNKIISIWFFCFLFIFTVKGFEDMNTITWIIFSVVMIGMCSLIFDAWKVIKKDFEYN